MAGETHTAEPRMVPVTLDPCLAKQEPGEPMFILLGRDSAAPEAIEQWCAARSREITSGRRPDTEEEWDHIRQVLRKAEHFREWRAANR
jgi:hypothetical protein